MVSHKFQEKEVFKIILPSQLCWLVFPIDNLHALVDTAKKILTKERLDRHIVGYSSGVTHFIHLNEVKEPQQKAVIFSEKGVMNDKIDMLSSLIGKLPTQATQNR